MPDYIEFPRGLVARTTNLRLRNQSRSLSETLSGFQQVTSSVTQRWNLVLEFNTMKREYILAYRAILAQLEGRLGTLRVPIVDSRLWPTDASLGIASSTHSDGSTFSDDTLYTTGDVSGITVAGTLGAKSIDVDLSPYGEVLQAGQYFGIDDDLYIATTVEYDELGVATIGFQPGLRRTYTEGVFRLRPYLLCRLADDDVGDHPLEWGIRTAPSLELVEVFT